MALEGGDVLKSVVIVHPSHAADQAFCSGLRSSLVSAGFVVVRDESRRVDWDTAVKLAADNAPSASVQALVGNARILAVARVDAQAQLAALREGDAAIAAATTVPATQDDAAQRLLLLFPRMAVDPIPSNMQAHDFVDTHLKAVLVSGLTSAAKVKPENPVKFLAEYLLENNPNKPPVVPPAAAAE
eukprot:CAMPEP_0174832638 /NCGR_PEP_ID=MMETSP1114-20130205/3780_1 /TAXON_ID=312471 /ORGANISM="Neobodo designis, Strain CCAP 1951/1" /LENGTH=185 /DNA_ID=CAMNT_0016066499 /DNA_START=48 /DNA_END=605 /DNA_ORIENTATION=+